MAIKIEVMPIHSAIDVEEKVAVAVSVTDITRDVVGPALLHAIVDKIAEQYVAEHYQEVVGGISPEAVSTMVMAEAGAKIRESLEKNIPARVVEVERTKTEVWQKGIMGGLKRVL